MPNLDTNDRWIIFQGDELIMVSNEGVLMFTAVEPLQQWFVKKQTFTTENGMIVHTVELQHEITIPLEVVRLPLKKALSLLSPDQYNAIIKAYTILRWDNNHRYCGRCGSETERTPTSTSFERRCPACGLLFYPRISPSIIVLIERGDELLMTRGHHFLPGVYGLVAGFVEPGENLEEAVHREVKEEVGLKIKNLRYFGSQPWPFPDSLMMGFVAEYEEGDLVVDPIELETAGWFKFDDLPGRPSTSVSIAGKLIDDFINKKTK